MTINLLSGVLILKNANLLRKESRKVCTRNKTLSTVNVETHFVSSVEKSSIGQLIAKCLRNGKSKTAVKVKI
jgi:hypothetical protein